MEAPAARERQAEDARMLARLGRADESLLSPIKHRSESGQRALVRLKVREALVRSRVNAMNSVRFLLKPRGARAQRIRMKGQHSIELCARCSTWPAV